MLFFLLTQTPSCTCTHTGFFSPAALPGLVQEREADGIFPSLPVPPPGQGKGPNGPVALPSSDVPTDGECCCGLKLLSRGCFVAAKEDKAEL